MEVYMKIFSKALLICVLAFVMLTAAACNGGNEADKVTPTPKVTATPGSNTIPGETYKFWSWQFQSADVYQGDTIRDQAMRERVQALQEELQITIEFVPNTGQWDMLRQSAFQGMPEVDGGKEGGLHTMLQTYLYQDVPGACLEPLSDHPESFDFSNTNKFEVEAQNEMTTFSGKLWYFIPIELGIHFECAGNVLVFNKRLVTEAGYTPEQLYGWYEDGTWTWDKFEEVLVATTDAGKNQWGIERGNSPLVAWALVQSNEGEYVRLIEDADGNKQDYFVGYEPNTIAAYEEYVKLAKDLKCMEPTYYGTVDQVPLNNFMNGKTAFMFTGFSTNSLDKVAQMTEDYGILPTPKGPANVADKDQYTAYFPHMNPYLCYRGTQNPSGTIEVLAKVFQPIYDADSQDAKDLYETEKTLFSRDEESKKVLDITEANKTFVRQMTYGFAMCGEKTFHDMLSGDAETQILDGEITAKAYFDSITDTVNAAIVANSPYTWQ